VTQVVLHRITICTSLDSTISVKVNKVFNLKLVKLSQRGDIWVAISTASSNLRESKELLEARKLPLRRLRHLRQKREKRLVKISNNSE